MTLQPPSVQTTSHAQPDGQRIVLSYDLTDEEQMASMSHLARRQRLRMLWYVIMGLVMIGAIFTEVPHDPVAFRLALGVTGGALVIVGLALPHLWRDRLRKIFAQTPDSGLSRVTFDETGMRDEAPVTETLYRWTAFTHYQVRQRRPQMLVLFRGTYGPVPVPRRACSDEAQWQALLELVATQIGRQEPSTRPGFPVIPASESRPTGADDGPSIS